MLVRNANLIKQLAHFSFMKPNLNSLTSLNKITQIRQEKQANDSDMARKSGKSFRLGEKIRLASTASREKGVLGARLSHIPRPTKKTDLEKIQVRCFN